MSGVWPAMGEKIESLAFLFSCCFLLIFLGGRKKTTTLSDICVVHSLASIWKIPDRATEKVGSWRKHANGCLIWIKLWIVFRSWERGRGCDCLMDEGGKYGCPSNLAIL